MHFSAEQMSQISGALVIAFVAVIGAVSALLVALVVLGTKKLTDIATRVELNTGRLDRQANAIVSIQNGGGDAKIEAMINKKIVSGELAKGGTNATDTNGNTTGNQSSLSTS